MKYIVIFKFDNVIHEAMEEDILFGDSPKLSLEEWNTVDPAREITYDVVYGGEPWMAVVLQVVENDQDDTRPTIRMLEQLRRAKRAGIAKLLFKCKRVQQSNKRFVMQPLDMISTDADQNDDTETDQNDQAHQDKRNSIKSHSVSSTKKKVSDFQLVVLSVHVRDQSHMTSAAF